MWQVCRYFGAFWTRNPLKFNCWWKSLRRKQQRNVQSYVSVRAKQATFWSGCYECDTRPSIICQCGVMRWTLEQVTSVSVAWVCESLARISGKATVVKLGNWPITRIPRHNASVIIGGKNLEWNLGNRNHLLWSPKNAVEAEMDYMHPRIALTVSWFVHQSSSIPFVPCITYTMYFSVD